MLVQLQSLQLAVKFPARVGTIWETHLKTVQAINQPELNSGVANLAETLSDTFVFDYDMTTNTFN